MWFLPCTCNNKHTGEYANNKSNSVVALYSLLYTKNNDESGLFWENNKTNWSTLVYILYITIITTL